MIQLRLRLSPTTRSLVLQHCRSVRVNSIGIPMIPESFRSQLFGADPPVEINDGGSPATDDSTRFNLVNLTKQPSVVGSGGNKLSPIAEHFQSIASDLVEPYRRLALGFSRLPFEVPNEFQMTPGWTRYERQEDGTVTSRPVVHPLEEVIVFDVELLKSVQHVPLLAMAASPDAWYCWCSDHLLDTNDLTNKASMTQKLDALIPLGNASAASNWSSSWPASTASPAPPASRALLVIGHNVGFDRSYIRDEYSLTKTARRFLDTMSLHIAVSGLTGVQRRLFVAKRDGRDNKAVRDAENTARLFGLSPDYGWTENASLNSLAEVYKLYSGQELDKEPRRIFEEGTLADVRANFSQLARYCATDVASTHRIFTELFSRFLERFPHPASLAGTMLMGSAFLPVSASHWTRYTSQCDAIFEADSKRIAHRLQKLAVDALPMVADGAFSTDPWLYGLDWTVPKNSKTPADKYDLTRRETLPKWFRDLCAPVKSLTAGQPIVPSKISVQTRVSPLLLRLTWRSFPLLWSDRAGWGYVVPGRIGCLSFLEMESAGGHGWSMADQASCDGLERHLSYPYRSTYELCASFARKEVAAQVSSPHRSNVATPTGVPSWVEQFLPDGSTEVAIGQPASLPLTLSGVDETTLCSDVLVPGCWFFKLPHKDGPFKRVGSPLSQSFLVHIEDDTLSASKPLSCGDGGESVLDPGVVLRTSRQMQYWRNNRERIHSQLVFPVTNCHGKADDSAAILPRIISAGTVTRRAVEPTWLTASNHRIDRLGSELKALVQAPAGWCFVGADVDSQELWIASLIGDSMCAPIHGSTPFGWMTLQGSKVLGTDMHICVSLKNLLGMTAKRVNEALQAHTAGNTHSDGPSSSFGRNEAKVLNYARIYGSGSSYVAELLRQFHRAISKENAAKVAKDLFAFTKGRRGRQPGQPTKQLRIGCHNCNRSISPIPHELVQTLSPTYNLEETRLQVEWVLAEKRKSCPLCGSTKLFVRLETTPLCWIGGSESHMFNKLESIADELVPRTPVLGCAMSKALSPLSVRDQFKTSRINWVVQSSAVDFLHLLLTSMEWLLNEFAIPHGRFVISIHDEVRYMVPMEHRYRAALALQLSNLFVRCVFSDQLGLNDLPLSVAFFSSIEIDRCLRKEPHDECITPSNPDGLHQGYGIEPGQSLDMGQLLEVLRDDVGWSLHEQLFPSASSGRYYSFFPK